MLQGRVGESQACLDFPPDSRSAAATAIETLPEDCGFGIRLPSGQAAILDAAGGRGGGSPPEGLDTREQPYNGTASGVLGIAKPRKSYEFDWEYADECLKRMQGCGETFCLTEHIPCGARILTPESCDVRACQRCAKRRIARLREKYQAAVEHFHHPALITLTVANVKRHEDLPDALGKLVGGFWELRRRQCWPEECKGFWSVEITWSPETGYHPHLHAVVDLPWIADLDALAETWKHLTGALHQPDIKRAVAPEKRAGLVDEAIKYICKQWELEDAPLRAILALTGRRRLFNAFGGLKPEDIEEEDAPCCCPRCGAPNDGGPDWRRESISAEDAVFAKVQSTRWADVYESWRPIE